MSKAAASSALPDRQSKGGSHQSARVVSRKGSLAQTTSAGSWSGSQAPHLCTPLFTCGQG